MAIGGPEHIRNRLCLFPNLIRVVKAPRARNQTLQLVTVRENDEHFVDEVMRQYAMGLIQSGPFLPSKESTSITVNASTMERPRANEPPVAHRIIRMAELLARMREIAERN